MFLLLPHALLEWTEGVKVEPGPEKNRVVVNENLREREQFYFYANFPRNFLCILL